MLKKIFLGLILCPCVLYAQNEVDALRYSQLSFGGTARFTSMAGAMGALGGDMSTLSFNPAGIGIYRKSEFNFTPSLHNHFTQSTYNGSPSNDIKYNFNFENIGLVGTKVRAKNDENNQGWISTSLGLAYNRTNNFHSKTEILGNNDYSMVNTFVTNANGYPPEELDPFAEGLAYDRWLINDSVGNYSYYGEMPPGIVVTQKKSIITKGGMGEFAISYGGNYSNKLYVGGTLGFASLRYKETSTFEEINTQDSTNLKSYVFENNLSTSGSGANFKFGLIYRVTDWIRIGGAIHTPTFFGMKDSYDSKITAYYKDSVRTSESPQGLFEYDLSTPFRAIGSLGFIIAKKGLLGIDYEYVDYSKARLSSTPEVFTDVNRTIQSIYTGTSNIRAGGEVRFDPFSIRAGYAYYGNPYAEGIKNDGHKSNYTLGFGIKNEGVYMDVAYVLTHYSDKYYLYNAPININTGVANDHSASGFLITVGVKY